MSLAWLSPLSAASAIGKVTVRVAEQVAERTPVDLWCSDRGDLHATRLPVVPYTVSDGFERALREYDAVVYSLGDHYPFHRDVFRMLERVPGLVVLHDFVMHHFFMGLYLEPPGCVEVYLDTMERHYGQAGRDAARASFHLEAGRWSVRGDAPPLWDTDRVADFPLFEDTLRHATAVVVHSDFLLARVRAVTDAPSRRLFLPAVQTPAPDIGPHETIDLPPGRDVLLTLGHVNPNKRVLEIVEALGRSPDLAARVIYVVAGELPPGPYPEQLRDAIARFGLESTVRLAGHLSDDALQLWLRRADVCLNLRHPVMEGASASLADQMLAGKAVIVTNDGVYAEVPDDCVRKIGPGQEADELPLVLRHLLDDPSGRRAMATRGLAYAETRFRADRYADELLALIGASGGFAAMVQFAERIGATLKQMGTAPGMAIVDTVARESADLFGEPVTSPWRPGAIDKTPGGG